MLAPAARHLRTPAAFSFCTSISSRSLADRGMANIVDAPASTSLLAKPLLREKKRPCMRNAQSDNNMKAKVRTLAENMRVVEHGPRKVHASAEGDVTCADIYPLDSSRVWLGISVEAWESARQMVFGFRMLQGPT